MNLEYQLIWDFMKNLLFENMEMQQKLVFWGMIGGGAKISKYI